MALENEANPARKQVDRPMHTAEHILTAVLMRVLQCGRPFTTHLEKRKSKADYRTERDLRPDEAAEVERQVNAIIAADLPVTEEFLPRADALKAHNLDRLPDDAGEPVRIVKVGDYDACPCIGPHVNSTKEIGAFRVVSTSWENGVLRVRFKAGPRQTEG